MRTAFKILFSVEVLNRYFGTGRWKGISIVPAPETELLLKQYQLVTRQVDNELLVITKVDSAGSAMNAPALYTKFTFMLVPQTPNYTIFSNLPLLQTADQAFSFHNLNKNEYGSAHYLTRPIAAHNATHAYVPGGFAKGADNKIYECIKVNGGPGDAACWTLRDDQYVISKGKDPLLLSCFSDSLAYAKDELVRAADGKIYEAVKASASVAPPDAAYWAASEDLQFVSAGDTAELVNGKEYRVEASGGVYYFKTSVKQKKHAVHIAALNPRTGAYDQFVLADTVNFDENSDVVQVNMQGLATGKYRVTVNDDTRFVFLSRKNNGSVPMFIDIYSLPSTDAQSIVDAGGKPKRTKFTVAFGARRVLWQYKTRTNIIDKIEDTSGTYTFAANGIRTFISGKPIPLSDTVIKTFVAKQGTSTIVTPLPNPTPDRLAGKQNEIYSTESFINF